MRRHHLHRAAAAIAIAASLSCGQRVQRPALVHPHEPLATRPGDTLKVHLRSGELFMLSQWTLDTAARALTGTGQHFSIRRESRPVRDTTVALDSVALFETNRHGSAFPLGMLGVGVMTTLGAYISAVCLVDPKSCFGSCPTFYVDGEHPERVQAEGFSSAVARVLEERDVDALPEAGARGRRVAIHMKNEAWETHVVRSVALLVVPRRDGERVFAGTDSVFHATSGVRAAVTCRGPEGDCAAPLARLDRVERRTPADSVDLAAREVIELAFPGGQRNPGLVLTARNSLITTFLFYQSMAWVGDDMGGMIAGFERGGRAYAESHFGMARLLGGIEVEVLDSGTWRHAGSFGEHGPIAADTKVLPLSVTPADTVRVRLRMAKGNWRVDWVALTEITGAARAIRVEPARVERDGRADPTALAALRDSARTLVSMPGDDFRLSFELPAPAERLELFLESQGYYYEWQRREWLGEKSAVMAAMVLMDPARALRVLAPAYKAREDRMEALFWASRFNRRTGGLDATR